MSYHLQTMRDVRMYYRNELILDMDEALYNNTTTTAEAIKNLKQEQVIIIRKKKNSLEEVI